MKSRTRRFALLLLLLLMLLGGLGVWGGLRLKVWAGQAKADLYVLRGLLASDPQWWPTVAQVQAARMRIEEADQAIAGVRDATLWLAKPDTLGYDTLDAVHRLVRVVWWSVLRVESAVEQYGVTNTASGVPVVIEQMPLQAGLQEVYRQRDQLVAVRHDLARIQPKLPRWLSKHALAALIDPFTMDAALLGLEAMGAEGERTYLVLIQNSDELRATGGFISAVATVRIADHALAGLDYMNSYDVEAYRLVHPPAPLPQQRIMDASMLLFRDANWSPDWPTSAQVAGALYQMDTGESVAGVIAIDTTFVEMILAALGPLELPDQGVTVSADNVIETIIGYWEQPEGAAGIDERDMKHGEWLAHRKDFGRTLMAAGMQRLYSLDSDDMVNLLIATKQAADSKHLLAWGLSSRDFQQAATRASLDGALRQTGGDYVMVVDTNMGWNKVDRNIQRSIDYRVDAARGQVILTLSYQNLSPAEPGPCQHKAGYEDTYELLSQGCYWNYVRVLAPLGTELVAVVGGDGIVDQGRERDKAVFGTLIVAPPAQTTSVQWTYKLPLAALDDEGYQLLVQKQPGTDGVPVSVRVSAPLDKKWAKLSPGWALVDDGSATISAALDHDLALAVDWR